MVENENARYEEKDNIPDCIKTAMKTGSMIVFKEIDYFFGINMKTMSICGYIGDRYVMCIIDINNL